MAWLTSTHEARVSVRRGGVVVHDDGQVVSFTARVSNGEPEEAVSMLLGFARRLEAEIRKLASS